MTNEERVDQYFKEIEEVFGTRENVLSILNAYEKFKKEGDVDSISAYDRITLGRNHKEYWVKFEIKDFDILNSFLMSWVVQGKSIAGVQGSVLDFGGVCDKKELKDRLFKMIEEL